MAPAPAAAQVVTLEACFVPGSGTVYRIAADGAPDACRSPKHVRFTWSTSVPSGTCPAGQFMVGLAPDRGLLCATPPSQPPPPPETSYPTGFEGVYALDPIIPLPECAALVEGAVYNEASILPGPVPGSLGLEFLQNGDSRSFWMAMGIYASFDPLANSFVIDKDLVVADQVLSLDVTGAFGPGGTVQLQITLTATATDGEVLCAVAGATTGTYVRPNG